MKLTKRTKDVLKIGLADKKASAEIISAIENGGSIPVLTADPLSPTPGQAWFLYSSSTPMTRLDGSINVIGGIGDLQIRLNSTLLSDTGLFGDPSYGNYGYVSWTKNYMPGPVVITPSPPQMGNINILFGNDKTWNDVITAFVAWADATLSAPGLLVCTLTQPANDGLIIPDNMQMGVYMSSDGFPETMTLKIRSLIGSYIFSAQLN